MMCFLTKLIRKCLTFACEVPERFGLMFVWHQSMIAKKMQIVIFLSTDRLREKYNDATALFGRCECFKCLLTWLGDLKRNGCFFKYLFIIINRCSIMLRSRERYIRQRRSIFNK